MAQAAFVWIGGEITTAAWNNQYNWAITGNTSFGGDLGNWGSSGPGTPGSDKWDQITLNSASGSIDRLEGWTLKLRLINSSLTSSMIKKLQGGCSVEIDADSVLTLKNFGGENGNDGETCVLDCDGVFNLEYSKNQGGEGILASLGTSGIMNLTSTSGTHTAKVKTVSATLEAAAISGTRKLITLGDGMSFEGAPVVTVNGTEGWTRVNNEQEAQEASENGEDAYWVTNDSTGISVSWLKGESETVPEPASATLSLLALAALAARRRRR